MFLNKPYRLLAEQTEVLQWGKASYCRFMCSKCAQSFLKFFSFFIASGSAIAVGSTATVACESHK